MRCSTLEKGLKYELGLDLNIVPLQGDYFDALQSEALSDTSARKFVLFLGSTIGNFDQESANRFMLRLAGIMRAGDTCMVGYDLKKHPQVIANAYDDSEGVTAQFNLNLLERMNRELDAHFDLDAFSHYPVYDPETGEAKSYLVSHKQQTVLVGALGRYFDFCGRRNHPYRNITQVHRERHRKIGFVRGAEKSATIFTIRSIILRMC